MGDEERNIATNANDVLIARIQAVSEILTSYIEKRPEAVDFDNIERFIEKISGKIAAIK